VSHENGSLSRVVLGDQVKEFVIEAIMNGTYKPGDRIVTTSLARQLGVSQAPVREAIRDLVLLGFLENEAFKGTSVRSFSAKELNEVYMVRASMESLAARLAAEKLTLKDAQELHRILEAMISAAQQQDEKEMVELDNQFHETILQIADNQLLYQLWQTLQFGTWTIVTTRMSDMDLEELARRHETLLAALETGDPRQAMEAMQHHIEDLGKPPKNSGKSGD
jgi:DNA-binding GntR family transcriptional regulator